MADNKRPEVTGWVGWVVFASFMMMLVGFLHLIAGVAALFKDDIYASTNNAVWVLDYTQWGWIHIIGGILALWAASSLLQGKLYGRTFAVVLALVSTVANMIFIPIYPIWALIIITVNVLVIWAVVVHGDELKD